MEENDPSLHKHGLSKNHHGEESAKMDEEPTTFHRELVHEMLAREMREAGMDCEPLPIGSSPLDKPPFSSNLFPMGSIGLTSRGVILVRGRKLDFVQILQRG